MPRSLAISSEQNSDVSSTQGSDTSAAWLEMQPGAVLCVIGHSQSGQGHALLEGSYTFLAYRRQDSGMQLGGGNRISRLLRNTLDDCVSVRGKARWYCCSQREIHGAGTYYFDPFQ